MDSEKTYMLIANDLQKKIEKITLQIKELEKEKDYYQTLLSKNIFESKVIDGKLRENSKQKIIIQNTILEILSKKSGKPQRGSEIYDDIFKIYPELKSSTYRSYLRDLKNKGLIKSLKRGFWVINK